MADAFRDMCVELLADYVPGDTKNLEMLRSAASALESTASDLTLAVSRLISRPKTKKKALIEALEKAESPLPRQRPTPQSEEAQP